jgi:polar amino acid transport system substrate-binding protein
MISRFVVSRRVASVLGAAGLLACAGALAASSASSASTPTAVTIGVDPTSLPYGGLSNGKLVGMDADVARAIAAQAGLKANLVQLTFDNAVPALKSGRADISFVGGWFDDATRQAVMNVVSYYQAPVGFVVKAGNPSHVGGTWSGRCGLNLATYSSSPDYLDILKADSKKCTKAGKKAITVSSFAGLAQGVLAVRSGRIDGFMDVVPAVAYQAHIAPGLTYVAATDQPVVIWGIGVRKNELSLADEVAKALKALTASGKLSAIWKKYGFPSSVQLSQNNITVNGKYPNG